MIYDYPRVTLYVYCIWGFFQGNLIEFCNEIINHLCTKIVYAGIEALHIMYFIT